MRYIKRFELFEKTVQDNDIYNYYIDFLKGGKGDKKTLEDIAKAYVAKHGGKYEKVLDVVKKNYKMGLKVEMEHTNKKVIADEISRDHLSENPKYYELLKKAHLADELE
jgi:hypothetical protein